MSPTRRLIAGMLLLGLLPLDQPVADTAERQAERLRMVEEQIVERGISDARVLQALREVPRHEFVPPGARDQAYGDHPLPIGFGQTISQPYIVALMTELLKLAPGERVLEVGSGSGYQAAVLQALGAEVYTIEIVEGLHRSAREVLGRRGLGAAQVVQGDGYDGLAAAAPFDAIIVTAAADHIPPPLLAQLKPGARMVIPVGPVHGVQRLVFVLKDAKGRLSTRSVLPVRFVPLTRGH